MKCHSSLDRQLIFSLTNPEKVRQWLRLTYTKLIIQIYFKSFISPNPKSVVPTKLILSGVDHNVLIAKLLLNPQKVQLQLVMVLHHRFGLATTETESGKNGQLSPGCVSKWCKCWCHSRTEKNRSLIMILSGGTPNNTGQNTTLFIHLVQQRSNIRDLVSGPCSWQPNEAKKKLDFPNINRIFHVVGPIEGVRWRLPLVSWPTFSLASD